MKLLSSTRAVAADPAKADQRIGAQIAAYAAGFAPNIRPDSGLAAGQASKRPVSPRGAESLSSQPMVRHANAPASAGRPRFRPVHFPNPDRHDA